MLGKLLLYDILVIFIVPQRMGYSHFFRLQWNFCLIKLRKESLTRHVLFLIFHILCTIILFARALCC